MESPIKMQSLYVESNKENIEARYEADEVAVPIKGIPELPEQEVEPKLPGVAVTIKEDEEVEPILQENPQRFVLFPIKYHEVSSSITERDLTRKVDLHIDLVRSIDMADVQEGRSIVLDCGRDRPIQRSTRLEQTAQR